MALFDELLPASFKGAEFLIQSASTQSGRKTVTHEFPNSDRRFVEDLGLLNKTFTIRGIITTPNYTQKKDALVSALESAGLGQLNHPTFGVQNVVSKPYTLTEDLTALGEAVFDMTFEIAQQPILPTQITGGLPTISQQATETIAESETIMTDNFRVSTSNNFTASLDQFTGLVVQFNAITNEFITDPEFFDSFFTDLTDFQEDLVKNIQIPADLATSFNNLFTALEDSVDTAEEIKRVFEKLYSFGDNIVTLSCNSVELDERAKNKNLVNFLTQANALIINYRNVPQIDFLTVDQIEEERKKLEDQFLKISDFEFINEFGQTLKDLRSDVREFFDNAALSAFKLSPFETNTIPSTVLVFNHYGDLENQDSIIGINSLRDVSFVEGTVNLLTK